MKLSLHTSPPSGDPSTSDSGDGRRDGDAAATEMDSATAMRLRRDGNNDATASYQKHSQLKNSSALNYLKWKVDTYSVDKIFTAAPCKKSCVGYNL